MNVGILIPGFSDGEQDWCIPVYLNLVRALAKTDSVRVFALRYPSRRDRYDVYGTQVISLGGHSSIAGVRRWLLLARTVSAVIREHRVRPFDVLHAIWADETGFAACIAGRLIGVPVVVSIAGGELVALPDYGLQSGRVTGWLVRQAIKHANQVIAPCRYAAQLIPHSIRASERVVIVPLGVDSELFRARSSDGRSTRLLCVGSLVSVKGHNQMLHVLRQLPDMSLDIVGEGPLLPALQAQAKTLGIRDGVVFHGAVRHEALPGYYQAAALLVLPSRHEAFGMVIAEAAACGLPTVGYATGVLPEFAENHAGIAVPVGDEKALVEAIRGLVSDPVHLAVMGKNARTLVEARYTIAAMAAGIRHVYGRL